MQIKILKIVIVVVAIVSYVFFMKYLFWQKRDLKDAYLCHVKEITHNNIIKCVVNPLRSIDFFQMTNDGDNLCKFDKKIAYVDYIGDSSMYMETNINE